MSVRGPQRLGLANQHEERSRCSSSLQLARRGLADVPSTAHTAAALQLKKAALDHHIARVSGPDAPLSLAPQCSQFARPRCANRTGAMLFGTLDGLNMLAFKSRGLRLNLKI